MKVQKFQADTMQEALQAVRNELGPDAVIMKTETVRKRKGLFGIFSKKVCEVLAGYDDEPAVTYRGRSAEGASRGGQATFPSTRPSSIPPTANRAAGYAAYGAPTRSALDPKVEAAQKATAAQASRVKATQAAQAAASGTVQASDLAKDISELKAMVQQLERRTAVTEQTPDKRFSRDVMALYRTMLDNGLEERTADGICARAEEIVRLRGADARDVVQNILIEMIGQPHLIEPVKYQRKAVMLVGPTGVGKTTTLIKLAFMLVFQKHVNVGIINTDSFRVAAQDHMKAYCDILKTDMITVYRPEEIRDALDAFKEKDVVLIDTVGKVSDDPEYRDTIKRLCDLGQIDEVFLALSASTSDRVLRRVVNNYSFLTRYSTIVTKTDEAPAPGVFAFLASISGRPPSYVTTGQMVPDDIKEVDPVEIADAILGPQQL